MMIKKSMQRLTILIILLITLSAAANPEIDYKAKYDRQVYDNEILKNKIISQEMILDDKTKTITEKNQEIEIQKIKEKERMLLDLFGVGISKDEVKGVIFGALALEVHPLFLFGLLF